MPHSVALRCSPPSSAPLAALWQAHGCILDLRSDVLDLLDHVVFDSAS